MPRAGLNLWIYRRIVDRANFTPGTYASDISLVNWPQNDFWLGDLLTATPEQQTEYLRQAKQLSLSLLYWMQTDAPRPDGGQGWKGLRLRKDVVGTEDGLAKAAYIRESRRIQAEFTILEQHVGAQMRGSVGGRGVRRFGRRGLLSDRSASHGGRHQLHRYQFAAVSDSAWRADSQAGRKSACRLQEYRHDAHHERLLPAAPGGMEHRRSGGRGGGAGHPDQAIPARYPRQ